MLNNWRMAELHAKEAPDRVLRARALGRALRPHEGRPDPPARLRRPPLRPPRPRRRPHRAGADPHPAAERPSRSASRSSWSARSSACSPTPTAPISRRASGYWRPTGEFVVFKAKAVVLATGGIGKSWKFTSNSWESTGDGHAMALWAGADAHRHGVRAVPPDRHGLAAVGARASSSPRACAATAGCCATPRASASCSTTSPSVPGRDGRHRGGGRPLVRRPQPQPAPAGAAPPRRGGPGDQLRGQGRPGHPARRRLPRHRLPPHARVHPAAAARRCTTSSRSWPASTSPPSPMEVGPTCHYMMGGVRVDADTQAATRPRPLRRRRGRRAACTAPTGSAATRCPTSSSSAGGPASAPPTTPRAAPARADPRRGGGRRGDRRGAGALRARGRREPLRRPARAAGDHAVARRHHPHRRPSSKRRSASSRSSSERAPSRRGRRAAGRTTRAGTWPPTCRRCSPSPSHVALGDAQPQGDPRRPHPRRLPAARPRDGKVNFVQHSTGGDVTVAERPVAPMPRRARPAAGGWALMAPT